MRSLRLFALFLLVTPLAWAWAACASAEPPAWRDAEQQTLHRHVRLTSPERFAKAGEAYFSPDAKWIIFQAVPRSNSGEQADPHYSMYIARLKREEGRITGMDEPARISPAGSANTCGFFHPTERGRVIFGSTLDPPEQDEEPGYQRGSSDYRWAFPESMEVVALTIPQSLDGAGGHDGGEVEEKAVSPDPLWRRPGYDAECAYSPDGRWIVHTRVEPDGGDGDIYVFDTETGSSTPLVTADGYDGGPFFSPDGKRICYRSDRRGDDRLQLFVADLAFDAEGEIRGVAREHQLTDDRHVNWAPYWSPDGEYLVFTTSRLGHHNYEVFSIEAPPISADDDFQPARRRVTRAAGFDGMPVFSPDGRWLMWTSQRRPADKPNEEPSSQIWIAEVIDAAP